MLGALSLFCVLRDYLSQQPGIEYVVAHRGVGDIRVVRSWFWSSRLLVEGNDAVGVVCGNDPEGAGLRHRHPDAGHRDPCSRLQMLVNHLAGIHPVDVVGSEDEDMVWSLVGQYVEVLKDRVGRSRKPIGAASHLGGDRGNVVAEHLRHAPSQRYVTVQAVALVLREHCDLAVAAVDEVGERKVDEPVDTAEGDCRLGSISRQRVEAPAFPARQHQRDELGRSGHPAKLAYRGLATLRHHGDPSRGTVPGGARRGVRFR